MNVVLVHGWLNSARMMRGLRAHLSREGHTCLSPSLRPSNGRTGIAALARQLRDVIDEALPTRDAPLALVGFSMGAIVGRYYLQELGGVARATAFFSICGPHAGTWLACFFPTRGARELRPGSALLDGLEATADRLAGLPITCYWTPFDLMIRPLASARWPRGEAVRVPALLHALMPFHPAVHRDITSRLAPKGSNPTF